MADFKPEWLDDWLGYLEGTDLDLEDHELRMTHQDGFAAGFVAGCESENARLTAALEAQVARLAPVVQWIKEHHVKKHDSDVLDIDHGPIVEWDYCDWCEDHGLEGDWPCMFVQALGEDEALATAGPGGGREGESDSA